MPRPCLLTGRLGRAALLRGTALQAAFALTVAIVPSSADAQPAPNAQPQGGQVVAGSAAIARTPGSTVITQTTDRAAINWRSFDVGGNQAVTFQQPSASSATLNRVTGLDPSAIAGRITANGQFILTNPNGVTFFRGAQVNAQSVIVSAPGITNQNFMAGRMVFDGKVNPNARIDNAGTITVKQAGLAALVAPSVANSGTITARLGQVILGGAAAHTLDMYGDGLVSIDVTKQVRQAPIGPDGKPVTALVTNTGTITADGGTIQLTARAVDGVVQNLVDAGGTIRANTLGGKTGQIEIAGTGGSVIIAGRIAADAPDGQAGTIVLNGSAATTLSNTAQVTADGRTGGGTVAIGTTLARARTLGAAPAATSARTTVASGARVSASATAAGNGGRVTVLSTAATSADGNFEAKGGAQSGNGGTVELSGETGFRLTGRADTSAPQGSLGTIVLDPRDLTITNTAPPNTANQPPAVTDPNIGPATGGTTTDAYVTPAQLQALTGDLHLLTTRDLTVAAVLSYNQGSVVLEAGRNLVVSGGASVTGGGNVTLTAASTNVAGYDPAGALSIGGALSGQTISLNAGTGGIALSAGVTASAAIAISTPGAVTQTLGFVTTPQLYGTAGSVNLPDANSVAGVGNGTNASFQTTSGGFLLANQANRSLTIGSAGGGGGLFVPTGQNVTLTTDSLILNAAGAAKSITAPGGTLLLQAGDADRQILVSATDSSNGVALFLNPSTFSRLSVGTLQLGTRSGTTNGPITLGQPGETIDLTAVGIGRLVLGTNSSISQGGPLVVADLGAAATNGTDLSNTGNRIGTLSSLGANGPTTITTSGNLALVGTLGADSATINAGGNITQSATSVLTASDSLTVAAGFSSVPGYNPAATLTLAGRVRPANTLNVSAGTGGIALTGTVFATDVVVSTNGPLTQGAGTMIATDLRGSAGSVNLASSTNSIVGVSSFNTTSPTGDFVLVDSTALSVGIQSVQGGITTQTGRSITLATDSLTFNGPAASAPGGVVVIEPLTASTPILLTSSTKPAGTLALTTNELTYIDANQLVLGAINPATGVVNLGTITLGKSGETIDLTNLGFSTLGLNTSGAVVQGGPLYVPTVTAGVGSLTLDTAGNLIGTIAGVTATGDIALHTDGDLAVGATSAGGNVNLSSSGSNGMTLFGNVIGQTVNLNSLSSSIANPTSSDPGITQTGGSISATTLTGAAGLAQLNGVNAVNNLGDFVTYGGLRLNNGTASLAITGAVSSTTGAITLNARGLTQTSGSSIVTPELDGSAAANTVLTAAGNAVAAIGSFTQSAGSFSLATSSPTLVLGNGGGQISATTGSLSFFANGVAIAPASRTVPALSAPSGTIDFSPYTTSRRIELIGPSAADANSLSIGPGVLAQISAQRLGLGLGQATTGPIAIGNAGETIDLRNRVGSLVLQTTGAVTEGAGASLDVGVLTGNAGSVALPSTTNVIAATSGLAATAGSLLLQTSGDLAVANTSATGAVTLGSSGNLAASGGLTAGGALTLTAGNGVSTSATVTGSTIAISSTTGFAQTAGSLASTGATTLSAPGRAIAQTGGTIAASSLTTTSATLSLPGANSVPSASIAATGPVTLNDTVALTLTALAATDASITTSAGLALNGGINASGSLALRAGGAITQPGGTITTGALTIVSSAQTTLGQQNAIATLASASSAGGLSIVDSGALTVTGAVADTTSVGLRTGGDLTLSARVTTGAFTITAGGAVTQNGGFITAASLGGTAASVATNIQNAVATLTNFTTTGSFTFTNSPSLAITGTITAGSPSGPAQTISLTSAGNLTETSSGALVAATFTGTAANATLTRQNQIGTLGLFTTIGPGNFSFANAADLSVVGAVFTGPLSLSSSGTLSLSGTVISSGAASLTGRTITQPGGTLTANSLALSASGTVTLGQQNAITVLAASSSNGGLTVVNAGALTVIGPVTDQTAVTLRTGGDLALAGPINTGTLGVTVGGALTQTAGVIAANTLGGTAGSAALTQPNVIATLTGFTTTGSFALTDSTALTIAGAITAGTGQTIALTTGTLTFGTGAALIAPGGTVSLAEFTPGQGITLGGNTLPVTAARLSIGSVTGGPISITGFFDLPGGTLDLQSGAAITETGAGAVRAAALTGRGSSARLTGANQVGTLGSFATTGNFTLANTGDLAVAGPVTAANVTLSSTGALAFSGAVTTPGTLSLNASGAITQSGGTLTAGTLTGTANSVALTGSNAIATLGNFTTTGGFALTDSTALAIASTVTAGTPTGPAQTISLVTAGALTETTAGALVAATLTGSAATASLTGGNQILTLGAFSTTGDLSFANRGDLGVAGPVAGANVSLSSTGSIALAGTITSPGLTTLTAGAAITQSGGILTTNRLSVTSATTTTLGQQNAIATLAAASSNGGLTVVDAGALTVTGPVTDQTAVNLRTGGALTLAGPITTGTLTVAAGGTLTQTAGIITANSLGGTAGSAAFTQPNAIATLTGFTTTGSFALTDSTALTIAGAITAGTGQTIALTTGTLTFGTGAALIAPGGTVSLAEFTPGQGITLGGNTLPVTAARLSIGSVTGGPISITGFFDLPGGTLDLQSGAAITETGAGAVRAAALTGRGSSARLTGANQVGTLGSFATTGNFTLANTGDLAVAGPVTAANVTLSSTGALAFSGAVTTPGTLSLNASGAITQSGGTLTAGTLTGTANSVALTGSNAIATLGNFTTTGGFALTDSTALAIASTVTAGTPTGPAQTISLVTAGALTETTAGALVAATLTGSAATASLTGGNQILTLGAFSTTGDLSFANRGDLGVAGPVAGANVSLSSTGSIALAGTITSPGLTTLTAGAAITQSGGILTTNRLSVTSATTTTLGQQNAIATLAAASSNGGLTVVDAGALTVTGPVTDQTAVNLRTGGALTLAGPITTGTLTVAAGGTLTQTAGIITANSLGGTAGSAAFTQPNAIATLTGFTTAGSFALTDSTALTIAGAITAGTGQTIALTTGTLTFGTGAALIAPGGTVSLAEFTPGQGITLGGNTLPVTAARLSIGSATAGPISITGFFDLPGGTLDLQSGAAITETGAGAVRAAALTGRGSSATLTGANQVGTLGSFATTGNFAFANTGDLAVAGPVSAANVTLSSTGALAFSGAVTTPGRLTLTAAGTVTQPGGRLTAASLTGSASNVALTGSNAIATLGNFTSTGGFALTDASPLSVAGTVTAGAGQAIALRTDALTFVSGSALIVPGGAITLAEVTPGVGITLSGSPSTISASSVTLGSATGGALTIAGLFDVSGVTLDLQSAGAITETGAGAIRAAGLTGRGSSATLTGANQVGTLGRFATTGDLSFNNATDLAVAGPVSGGTIKLSSAGNLALGGTLATPGSLTLTAGGAITQPGGSLSAASLTGSAVSAILDQAANSVPNLAGFITTGDFTYTNNGNLAVTALVDPNTVTMNVAGSLTIASVIAGTNVILNARDGIIETPTGQIVATTLAGSADSAALTSANQVDTVGAFATTNGFLLNTTRALVVTGPLTDQRGGIALTASSIDLAGPVSAPALNFATPGALRQNGGPLSIGTLSGTANSIDLGNRSPATIGALGAVTAATTLAINDASALRVAGPVAAPGLTIAATGALVLDGGSIRTDGQPFSAQLAAAPAPGGSNLAVRPGANGTASIVQLGTTTVTSLSGGSATLRFDLPAAGGTLLLNDLQAANARVVLSLGSGNASGTLNVSQLAVLGSGGRADLTGQIGTRSDPSAAQLAQLLPGTDLRYTFNQCAIASVTCSFDSIATIFAPNAAIASILRPDILTLDVLDLSVTRDRDDPTLLLPNISDKDY